MVPSSSSSARFRAGVFAFLAICLLPAVQLAQARCTVASYNATPAAAKGPTITNSIDAELTVQCNNGSLADVACLLGNHSYDPLANLGAVEAACGALRLDSSKPSLECLLTFRGHVTVDLKLSLSGMNLTGVGGVVCVKESAQVSIIQGSSITHNEISGGSLITVTGSGNLTIVKSMFSNNTGLSGTISSLESSSLHVVGSQFLYNVAHLRGGALAAQGNATVQIVDSVFHGNVVLGESHSGGAIQAIDNAHVSIHNGTFRKNTCDTHRGGTLYLSNEAIMNVSSSLFEGNYAKYGGALSLSGRAVMNVSSSNFTRNYASNGGSVVYMTGTSNITMTGCNVSSNTAKLWAGAMLLEGTDNSAIFHNLICSNNTAGVTGGCMVAQMNVTVVMKNCSIVGNVARSGGGLMIQNGVTLDLEHVKFINNRAEQGGGVQAINLDPHFKARIRHALFTGHRDARLGGAISLQGGNAVLGPNVTISDNHVDANGGGLLLVGGVTDITANVTITNNTAGTTGGGIHWMLGGCDLHKPLNECARSVLTVSKHSYITNNSAALAGGGMFIEYNISSKAQADHDYGDSVKFNRAAYADADVFVVSKDCGVGQFQKEGSDWCDKCPPGQYNIDQEDPTCHFCPEKRASCTLGGAVIVANSMFWHTNDSRIHCKLDEIIRCPNPQACEHDVARLASYHPHNTPSISSNRSGWAEYEAQQCQEGYEGILCTACKADYGRTDAFACELCLGAGSGNSINKAGVAAIIATYFMLFVIYLFLTTLLTLYSGFQASDRKRDTEPVCVVPQKAWLCCLEFDEVSKAFVTYLQYTIGIIAKLPLAWPRFLDGSLRILTKAWGLALGSAVSLDCVMPDALQHVSGGVKAIINLVAPLITLLAVMLCHILVWWLVAWLLRNSRGSACHTARVPFANGLLGIQVVYAPRATRCSSSDSVDDFSVYEPHKLSRLRRIKGYLAALVWKMAEACGVVFGWSHYCKALGTFLIAACVVNGFFWYPSVARVAMGAFTCGRGCSGSKYWVLDTRKVCPWSHEDGHQQTLPWALGVGIPASAVCLLLIVLLVAILVHGKNKGKLNQRYFRMKFGYLYSDHRHVSPESSGCHEQKDPSTQGQAPAYRVGDEPSSQRQRRKSTLGDLHRTTSWDGVKALFRNLYYRAFKPYLIVCWDAVLHIQTLILVFISVYGQFMHEYYQVLGLCLTFASYLVLLIWLKPYNHGSQQLQTLSFCTMFVTSMGSLTFIPPDGIGASDLLEAPYTSMIVAVEALLVTANVALILLMLILLLCLLFKDAALWFRRLQGAFERNERGSVIVANLPPEA